MSKPLPQPVLTLHDVLRLIDIGAIGLPDFQRRFIWEHHQIRSLLATIFMGWPAGLILLMEAPPTNFFAVRNIEGLIKRSSGFRHLILDGQQRVTALTQAFGLQAGSDSPIWYLDVDEFERGILEEDVEEAFVRRLKNTPFTPSNKLIPVAALRSEHTFQKWRDQCFNSAIIDTDNFDSNMFDRVNKLWLNHFSRVPEFTFPCTVLPSNMPLGSVSMIFEKLNTAGTQLDTFDLVVAHVYKDGKNLRSLWEEAVSTRPVLQKFSPSDPLVAAELISMVERGDTRRSGLLRIDPEVLWNNWKKAVSAIESAAIFLMDRAGISSFAHLPHRGVLLVLAGVAYESGGLDSRFDDLYLYWVFSRGLGERFNAAVNTRVVHEFRELLQATRGGKLQQMSLSAVVLLRATVRANSSISRTVQALIRRNGPLDYPEGLLSLPLSPSKAVTFSLIHEKMPGESDRVLSLIMGTPRTQAALRRRPLSGVHDELLAADPGRVAEFIESQLLPPVESSAWESAHNLMRERANIVVGIIHGFYADSITSNVYKVTSTGSVSDRYDILLASDDAILGESVFDFLLGLPSSHDKFLASRSYTDVVSELHLLANTHEPLSRAERIRARLLYARALQQSGEIHGCIRELELASRDATGSDEDTELARMKPIIALELGKALIRSGRIDEGVVALSDGLSTEWAAVAPPLVQASMMLEFAKGLALMGDTIAASTVARDLLNTGMLGLGDEFPELVASATELIERTTGTREFRLD